MAAPTNFHLNLQEPLGVDEEQMTIPHLIKLKKEGGELSTNQIKFLVASITNHTMEDSQLGAILMAICLKGMTTMETNALTRAMKESGEEFHWPPSWKVVDKHSTGGVGDKVSLILAPALASLGLKVPMISGRGLGLTGGTLDKLESIPGFQIYLSQEKMMDALESAGCCIVGQTESLVPADKRMYKTRDVTRTVDSPPLIVSSIISKKACESLHSLVLDVKFGSGAFSESQFEAETLATSLVETGMWLGIHTTALVTRMDSPVGRKVGNALEVEEALECLRGNGHQDLTELVVSLGAELLLSSGNATSSTHAKEQITETIENGAALKTFAKMMQAQGVSKTIAEQLIQGDFSCLPSAQHSTPVISQQSGTINCITAVNIAQVCLNIGAGRLASSDPINYGVGMVLKKGVGDPVEAGETWAEILHDGELTGSILRKAESALIVGTKTEEIQNQPLIARRIGSQ